MMNISNNTWLLIVVVVVVIILVGIAVVLRRRKPERPKNPYIEGLTRLIDGDRAGAFERLQASVRGGFAPTDAYIRLGKMLRNNGDAGKALQIHKSLTVKSDLTSVEKVELFVNIAEDYAELGRPEQAVSVLETAVRKMNLRDVSVFSILARESHRLGRTEDAYAYLRDLKKFNSVGEREIALYLASAGADMAADDNDPQVGLKDARRTLQRALKHDPDCAPAHLALGDVEDGEGNDGGAIEHWRRAAVLSEELSRAALTRLVRLLFDRGRFSDIEKIYHEVLASRPQDEHATLSLASFYKKQGRVEDAIVMLEEFRTAQPRSVEGTLLLMGMYASARDVATLERFLDEIESGVAASEQFVCSACGKETDVMRWHCGHCNGFDTYVAHTV